MWGMSMLKLHISLSSDHSSLALLYTTPSSGACPLTDESSNFFFHTLQQSLGLSQVGATPFHPIFHLFNCSPFLVSFPNKVVYIYIYIYN